MQSRSPFHSPSMSTIRTGAESVDDRVSLDPGDPRTDRSGTAVRRSGWRPHRHHRRLASLVLADTAPDPVPAEVSALVVRLRAWTGAFRYPCDVLRVLAARRVPVGRRGTGGPCRRDLSRCEARLESLAATREMVPRDTALCRADLLELVGSSWPSSPGSRSCSPAATPRSLRLRRWCAAVGNCESWPTRSCSRPTAIRRSASTPELLPAPTVREAAAAATS